MKKVVRDDIIDLITFTKAEFKYLEYLNLLKECGNYCFLSQFRNFIPKGRSIVNGLIENNLIGTESINKNYKYIYLTDTAMKFLMLRSSDKDFSNQSKKSISVKKVSKYPSEKQLLSAAYKFHMLVNGDNEVSKETILENIRNKYQEKYFYKYIDGIKFEELKENCIEIKNLVNEIDKKILQEKENLNVMKEISNNINLKGLFLLDESSNKIKEIELKIENLKNEIREKEKYSFTRIANKKDITYIQNTINELNGIRKFIEFEDENKKNCTYKYNKMINDNENRIKELTKLKDHYLEILKYIDNASKEADLKFNMVEKKIENLYDISKIIVRVNENILEFLILDTGSLKNSKSYAKIINSLLEELNEIKIEKTEVVIYSYSENRAKNLEKEFLKIKQVRSETIISVPKKRESRYTKEVLRKANVKRNDNIFYGNVTVNSECYYLGAYKEIDSSKKYIKVKDLKVIEELIDKLK